jgi:hypothetical protein
MARRLTTAARMEEGLTDFVPGVEQTGAKARQLHGFLGTLHHIQQGPEKITSIERVLNGDGDPPSPPQLSNQVKVVGRTSSSIAPFNQTCNLPQEPSGDAAFRQHIKQQLPTLPPTDLKLETIGNKRSAERLVRSPLQTSAQDSAEGAEAIGQYRGGSVEIVAGVSCKRHGRKR